MTTQNPKPFREKARSMHAANFGVTLEYLLV